MSASKANPVTEIICTPSSQTAPISATPPPSPSTTDSSPATSKAKTSVSRSRSRKASPSQSDSVAPVIAASTSNTAIIETSTTTLDSTNKTGKEKNKKTKMIRDGFTMPEADYLQLAELKKKCLKAGIAVKKSELLRIGLQQLMQLPNQQLFDAVTQLEKIKTGRPAKKA